MSESGRKDLAYPKSQTETPAFYILRFCGGKGGGDCVYPLNDTEFVIPIRVPKHLVFNRSLLVHNPEFFGVDIFSDGGAVGLCANSAAVRQSWWLAFSDDGVLSETEVKATGIEISAAPPFDIEVDASKLPQPVLRGGGANPNWENIIYMHIWWGNGSFVSGSSYLLNRDERVLEVTKHNYDIKI